MKRDHSYISDKNKKLESDPKKIKLDEKEKSKSRERSPTRSNDEKSIKSGEIGTNVDRFFNLIVGNKSSKVKFVIVNHIVPTLPPFLRALSKIGEISVIIPKGSHKDENVEEYVKSSYEDVFLNDDMKKNNLDIDNPNKKRFDDWLSEKDNCCEFLEKILQLEKDDAFIIIDIGGYFASPLCKIVEKFGDRFKGIVEDTENGYQKYLTSINDNIDDLKIEAKGQYFLNFPFYSVARCKLKETEDYNVGKSIVEASGTILRTNAHTILERMKTVGVIGFGKIGRSIAEHLRQKNISRVIVYDMNPIRQMSASAQGFESVKKEELLVEAEMIFGATGSRSLEGYDFYSLRDNVFIASCTSKKDEFNLKIIKKEDKEKNLSPHSDPLIEKYYLGEEGEEKRVNLLHGGDAVNFVHGAVNGPYIYSVQAALLQCAINIIFNDEKTKIDRDKKTVIYSELDEQAMSKIATYWLQCFENFSYSRNDFVFENEDLIKRLETGNILKSDFYLHTAFHIRSSCQNLQQFEVIKYVFDFFCKLSYLFVDKEVNLTFYNKCVDGFKKYRHNTSIELVNVEEEKIEKEEFSKAMCWLIEHKFFRIFLQLGEEKQLKNYIDIDIDIMEKMVFHYFKLNELVKLEALVLNEDISLETMNDIKNIIDRTRENEVNYIQRVSKLIDFRTAEKQNQPVL